jgi:hypothetical protein
MPLELTVNTCCTEDAPPKKKAKTLDDLFRSTKTEPRIYWLPADDASPTESSPAANEEKAAVADVVA